MRAAFLLIVLVTLAISGSIALMVLLMQIQPGFMGMAHFTQPHHRIHDLTFGFLFGTAVVGMLVQLRVPSQNIAGQLMALLPWGFLMLLFAVTERWVFAPAPVLGALTLAAAMVHPGRRGFLRACSASSVSPAMLALVMIAAAPFLVFAFTNFGLQRTLTNDHAVLGHYGFMAAFSLNVIGVGVLASLRPDGWRLTAWVAGLLPALLGLVSIALPDRDSSLSLGWALAAIAWGATFITVAEFVGRRRPASSSAGELTSVGVQRLEPSGSRSTTGGQRGVVLGLIALIVLALLLAVQHFTGGGFRPHGP